MIGLTPTTLALLRFIEGFIEDHGWSPSFEEMGAALGLKSRASVFHRLNELEKRGFITRTPNLSRSVVVLRRSPGQRQRSAPDITVTTDAWGKPKVEIAAHVTGA